MNDAIRDEFAKLLVHNDYLQQSYVRALKAGLSTEESLMSMLVEMDRRHKRELAIIEEMEIPCKRSEEIKAALDEAWDK